MKTELVPDPYRIAFASIAVLADGQRGVELGLKIVDERVGSRAHSNVMQGQCFLLVQLAEVPGKQQPKDERLRMNEQEQLEVQVLPGQRRDLAC